MYISQFKNTENIYMHLDIALIIRFTSCLYINTEGRNTYMSSLKKIIITPY